MRRSDLLDSAIATQTLNKRRKWTGEAVEGYQGTAH